MERVKINECPREAVDERSERRLGPALGTTDLALNRYLIAPGDALPSGLHAHHDQEEVFVVIEGTATFETFPSLGDCEAGELEGTAGEEITVEAGEVIRFAPGDFQSGRNDNQEPLVVLAIGAPLDSTDVRVPLPCPDCDVPGLRLDGSGAGLRLTCDTCAATHEPAPCPGCGATDLRATLGADCRPVVRCRDCGASYPSPPVEE